MIVKGHINSIEDVKRVSEVASRQMFDIFLHTEDALVDAKTNLALYTLVGKDVDIVFEDNINEKNVKKVVNEMGI